MKLCQFSYQFLESRIPGFWYDTALGLIQWPNPHIAVALPFSPSAVDKLPHEAVKWNNFSVKIPICFEQDLFALTFSICSPSPARSRWFSSWSSQTILRRFWISTWSAGAYIGKKSTCVTKVLSLQKVLSGCGRATRRWPMYFPIRRSLLARPEPDNTFWTASTGALKGCISNLSCSAFCQHQFEQ